MDLNSTFSLLGSVASLAAIPLSVYLYLRSKEARIARVRREVVKILSYQIGEGRDLTLFTIVTVLRSKIRDEGVREGPISVEQVVEDLVAETITEPMLDPKRKDQVLNSLSRLYHLGAISRFLERYPITVGQLARWAAQEYDLQEEDKRRADVMVDALGQAEEAGFRRTPSISTLFAFTATIATVVFSVFR